MASKPLNPKASREKLGLTQTQMGTLLGYSGENVRQMVYDIETGRRDLMPCQRRLLEAYLSGYRPVDWPLKPESNARFIAGPAKETR
jgi:transcriptional regulator with XRE-family HTH domain